MDQEKKKKKKLDTKVYHNLYSTSQSKRSIYSFYKAPVKPSFLTKQTYTPLYHTYTPLYHTYTPLYHTYTPLYHTYTHTNKYMYYIYTKINENVKTF